MFMRYIRLFVFSASIAQISITSMWFDSIDQIYLFLFLLLISGHFDCLGDDDDQSNHTLMGSVICCCHFFSFESLVFAFLDDSWNGFFFARKHLFETVASFVSFKLRKKNYSRFCDRMERNWIEFCMFVGK